MQQSGDMVEAARFVSCWRSIGGSLSVNERETRTLDRAMRRLARVGTTILMMPNLIASLRIAFHLIFFASPLHAAEAAPSPRTPMQYRAAAGEAAWTSIDFLDLVRTSGSDCAIKPGNLVQCAAPLKINALEKKLVLGHGTIVEFLDSHAGKGGVVLSGAVDVVLSDIQIGWLGGGARDPLIPGAQRIQSFGNVVACGNSEPGGVLSLDLALEGMQPLGSVSVWDDALGWPWYRAAPDKFEVHLPKNTLSRFSAGRSDCVPRLTSLVGRRVLVRHIVSTNPAFLCWGCRNVAVEKVRVTSAPGMAFVFGNGGSLLTLRDDVVAPKCSPNCLHPEPSVTADASHFSAVGSNIVLEGNDFGWQGDDGANITGLLIPARAEADTSARWILVDEQWRGRLSSFAAGNGILVFDRGLSALGSAEVLAVAPSEGRVRVSQLPVNKSELIIARADMIPTNIVVRNNHFHDNRARGILMGGSDALIENNEIDRVTMEAILIPADTGPWYEGPGATHVEIKGNRIADVNRFPAELDYPSAISAGASIDKGYTGAVGTPIRDIVVEGNSFKNIYSAPDVPIFFGRGVQGGSTEK